MVPRFSEHVRTPVLRGVVYASVHPWKAELGCGS